jgi:hypothetical protein
VQRAGDPPGLVLVWLSYVDELGVAVAEQGRGVLRAHLLGHA